jgi:plastocyanin
MNISGFNITISLATALVALALMPVANARAGDFIYGDDFDAGPSCTGVVSPGIAALASPTDRATTLGTQSRYLVKIRSCGYAGSAVLAVSGSPASWSTSIDPSSLTIANNGYSVGELSATIPTNGDSGTILLDVGVQIAGNTAHTTATIDVANQVILRIDDGTGSGSHSHFPPFLTIKSGTMIRFVDDDSVLMHEIHSSGGAGFLHQSPPGLSQGQEYDVTPTDPTYSYLFYCHSHPDTEITHLTVQ